MAGGKNLKNTQKKQEKTFLCTFSYFRPNMKTEKSRSWEDEFRKFRSVLRLKKKQRILLAVPA